MVGVAEIAFLADHRPGADLLGQWGLDFVLDITLQGSGAEFGAISRIEDIFLPLFGEFDVAVLLA